jgi:lipopolysaccharide transport system permease protein
MSSSVETTPPSQTQTYRPGPDVGADEVILRPGGTSQGYWVELWKYRELFYFLAWRDLKIRYKQTTVGVVWAVLRPLLMTFIFVFVFGKVGQFEPPPGIPYTLLVLSGMIAWQFFATVMGDGSNSVLSNANLISKVYFPRIVVPASVVAVALADLGITALITVGFMAWYAFLPPLQVLLLPLFLVLALAAAMGVGFWLSALTVRYRDVRLVVPFLVQFGLFVTPVGYRLANISEEYRLLYALNPMVGVIEGFRWCLLGTGLLGDGVLPVSTAMAVFLLVSGFWYFRKTERVFADTI